MSATRYTARRQKAKERGRGLSPKRGRHEMHSTSTCLCEESGTNVHAQRYSDSHRRDFQYSADSWRAAAVLLSASVDPQ